MPAACQRYQVGSTPVQIIVIERNKLLANLECRRTVTLFGRSLLLVVGRGPVQPRRACNETSPNPGETVRPPETTRGRRGDGQRAIRKRPGQGRGAITIFCSVAHRSHRFLEPPAHLVVWHGPSHTPGAP